MASDALHEDPAVLSDRIKNLHRGIVSLMEELEAIDWYGQRAEACTNDELKAVLVHNMEEEMEHASMTLEWIRRASPAFETRLREALFKDGPITGDHAEEAAAAAPATRAKGSSSLGVGSLRRKRK